MSFRLALPRITVLFPLHNPQSLSVGIVPVALDSCRHVAARGCGSGRGPLPRNSAWPLDPTGRVTTLGHASILTTHTTTSRQCHERRLLLGRRAAVSVEQESSACSPNCAVAQSPLGWEKHGESPTMLPGTFSPTIVYCLALDKGPSTHLWIPDEQARQSFNRTGPGQKHVFWSRLTDRGGEIEAIVDMSWNQSTQTPVD